MVVVGLGELLHVAVGEGGGFGEGTAGLGGAAGGTVLAGGAGATVVLLLL